MAEKDITVSELDHRPIPRIEIVNFGLTLSLQKGNKALVSYEYGTLTFKWLGSQIFD